MNAFSLQWTTSGFLDSLHKVYTCGIFLYLGGPGLMTSSGFMERTWIGFSTHNMIYFDFTIALFGSWQASDSFSFQFNNGAPSTMSPYLAVSNLGGNNCGSLGVNSLITSVVGKASHTGSTLTFRLTWSFQGNGSPSLGIKDFSASFVMKTPGDSEEAKLSFGNTGYSYSTSCPLNQYLDTSNGCQPCAGKCYSCFGSTVSQCYRPDWDGFYDGSVAQKCTSPCLYCYGTSNSACYRCSTTTTLNTDGTCQSSCVSPLVKFGDFSVHKCIQPCASPTPYMLWNETCVSSCNFPLISTTDLAGRQICQYPCGNSIHSFLYYNGSCLSTCPSPGYTRIENNYQFCDACAPGNFMYQNGVCLPVCDPPFSQTTIGGSQLCLFPCSAGQFLNLNGTCSSFCPEPYIQSTNFGFGLCSAPCLDGLKYYPDQSVCKTCDYPRQIVGDFCVYGLSADEVKLVQQYLNTTSLATQSFALAASVMSVINPADASAFFMVALVRMLSSVRFLDLRYSADLQLLFDEQVDDKSPLYFIIQAQNKLKEKAVKHSIPEIFSRYHLHSSFIINFFAPLTSLILIFLVTGLISLLVIVTKKYKRFNGLVQKIKNVLAWNFIISFSFSCYGSIILYTSLELRTAQPQSLFAIGSIITCILINCIPILIFIETFIIIHNLQKERQNAGQEQWIRQFSNFKIRFSGYLVIFENFKDAKQSQITFFAIYSLRICVFFGSVAYLFDYPLAQAIIIFVLNLSILVYLAVRHPQKSKLRLAQVITQELILLIANTCVLVIAILDTAHTEALMPRKIASSTIFYSNVPLMICGYGFIIVHCIVQLRDLYTRRKSNRVISIVQNQASEVVPIDQTPTQNRTTEALNGLQHTSLALEPSVLENSILQDFSLNNKPNLEGNHPSIYQPSELNISFENSSIHRTRKIKRIRKN